MERLSGLDAGFLYAESSTVPLNVCSVVELDTSR
jgi:diacylglycerol O-acyltransferase